MSDPGEVMIGGVRYVPVASASPAAQDIEDAITEAYWGDGPCPSGLRAGIRVLVTDDEDGGDTIGEFTARILAVTARREQAGGS